MALKFVEKERNYLFKSTLKSQSPLKHPQTHSSFFPALPSQGYHIPGKEIEVCGSGRPLFFPVVCVQLAGLPQYPAPSAVSPGSPVLNPKPYGNFSWPTSKSPFTPFLPAASLLHSSKLLRESSASQLHLAFGLPKLRGKGSPKATWFSPYSKAAWSFLSWLLYLGLNPSTNLPLQLHF